jgi:hypothetical protein
VAAAAGDHAVLAPEQIPAALREAALAVVDVSTVLSDAIRAGVPVAVPALDGRSGAEMRDAFPTVAAATVLGDVPADLIAALADALGADVLRAARRALAERIAGQPGDFGIRFGAAVAQAAAAQRRRRAFARPGVTG